MLTTLGTISRHGWGWGRAVTGHTTFPSRHVNQKQTHETLKNVVASATARAGRKRQAMTESWRTTISHYRTMASSACQTKATGYMLFPSTPRRHALAQACHSAQTRTGQAWNHAALHTPRADSTTGTLMKTPQQKLGPDASAESVSEHFFSD